MGRLTTHVLDTAHGKPGADIEVELYAVDSGRRLLKKTRTNADGRCEQPLLEGDAMAIGRYELVFHAGNYFASQGVRLPEPRFVDVVTLTFGIADVAGHYHVPLLVSPWSYTTYRGS